MKCATVLTNSVGVITALCFIGYAGEWKVNWTLFSMLVVGWNCMPGIVNASLVRVAARRVGGATIHFGVSVGSVLLLAITYFEGFVRSPDAQNAILLLVVPGLQFAVLFLAFVWISFLPTREAETVRAPPPET